MAKEKCNVLFLPKHELMQSISFYYIQRSYLRVFCFQYSAIFIQINQKDTFSRIKKYDKLKILFFFFFPSRYNRVARLLLAFQFSTRNQEENQMLFRKSTFEKVQKILTQTPCYDQSGKVSLKSLTSQEDTKNTESQQKHYTY